MARSLLIFGLFFVGHIIIADAKPYFLSSTCQLQTNVTGDALTRRNTNLTEFLLNLSSQAQSVVFYNATNGDKLHGVFQCRYDLSQKTCGACVEDAVQYLSQQCFVFDDSIAYYEECVLRYAYRDILSFNGTVAMTDVLYTYSNQISNITEFNQVLANAIDEVMEATAKNSKNGIYFASNETSLTSSEKLYCFAQCSPILDSYNCQVCLQAAFSRVNKLINLSTQAVIMAYQFCQLKYDNKSFLFQEDSLAISPVDQHHRGPASASNKKPSMKPAIIIAITSATSLGLLLLLAGLCLFRHRRSKTSFDPLSKGIDELRHGAMKDIGNFDSLQFDFKGVQAATSNFAEVNKLGRGGFGAVYKGKFSNGEEIAVKRLSKNSQQGVSEFKNEVVLLAKLQHKNLVKLLGFCTSRHEKVLIYEFLSNSSLNRFLYDPLRRASLQWELRFKIITDISRGLLYLHEDSRLKIIHRDLKTSNILLDDAMNAKIADFGLARLFDSDQTRGNTMRIAGTYGYMAPEYVLGGHFSVKSDVYSFGVIVLEIVSGQRNDFFQQEPNEGLLYRAWRLWNEDATLELVDPLLLRDNFSSEEAKLCIQIGLLCVQEDPAHRPRMVSIVPALNGESITLPLPKAPHIFTISPDADEVIPFNLIEIDDAYTGTTNITYLDPR